MEHLHTVPGVEVVSHRVRAPEVVLQPLQGLCLATFELKCALQSMTKTEFPSCLPAKP